MEESVARSPLQAPLHAGAFEMPAWKTILGAGSAVLLALAFLVAGVWKITDTYNAAQKMAQLKVPGNLALFTAISFGIVETFGGTLLLIPRFRRWGAWLVGGLLIAFMVYVGYYYDVLRGADCSCFPWLKRAVGPGFFLSDGAMLLMAVLAGWWARPSEGKRTAGVVLGAISVFALVSFGMAYGRQSGTPAPAAIVVDGKPHSLTLGRKLIYFFDPECSHCYQAAKAMAAYPWNGVEVIGAPVVNPQFAPQFLKDTGLKAVLTSDAKKLKETFPFGDAPFAVALENGRQKASFITFDASQPKDTLAKLGWLE